MNNYNTPSVPIIALTVTCVLLFSASVNCIKFCGPSGCATSPNLKLTVVNLKDGTSHSYLAPGASSKNPTIFNDCSVMNGVSQWARLDSTDSNLDYYFYECSDLNCGTCVATPSKTHSVPHTDLPFSINVGHFNMKLLHIEKLE
jgi:hypothetical protein